MKVELHTPTGLVTIDLLQGTDLSMPLADGQQLSAWAQPVPRLKPVRQGDWEGKVSRGASVNFNDICFNPHAHMTHTECLGHITHDFYSVNQIQGLHRFFSAFLLSVEPQPSPCGFCIGRKQLEEYLPNPAPEALIIRTLPNLVEKKSAVYSGTNPPFLQPEAARLLAQLKVRHLLVDLPSVDPEHDEGRLLAHKAFWRLEDVHTPGPSARYEATITELIFVPNTLADGLYYLQLGLMPVENDAAPSRPVLFKAI